MTWARAPHRALGDDAVDHRQTGGAVDRLGAGLVHRQRRGQHAGMRIGDAHPFQQALHAAILAPAAVQRVEHDVGRRSRRRAARSGPASTSITVKPAPAARRRIRAPSTATPRARPRGRPSGPQPWGGPARLAATVCLMCRACPVPTSGPAAFGPLAGSVTPGRPTRMISHLALFRCVWKTLFRDLLAQAFQVGGRGAARVDQEIGMHRVDICAPPRRAPRMPGRVDHLPRLEIVASSARAGRGKAGRVAEGRSRAAVLRGLAGVAAGSWSAMRASSASGVAAGARKVTSVIDRIRGRSVWR